MLKSGTRRLHSRRAPLPTPALTEIIQRYASSPPRPLDLASLLAFGRPVTRESVVCSVGYALAEIPRRLALRVRSLESLPFIVGTNPYVASMLSSYKESLQLLATYPAVNTLDENKLFTEALSSLVERHANDIPTMAKGFLESAKYMSPTQISNFLDGAIRNRISVRLIAEQHIAISHALEEEERPGNVGVVDTQCSPLHMIRMCESYVGELCSATLGASPSIVIDGHADATFPYVPVHLEYILTEILKNSFRATVEHHKTQRTMPPVRITLSQPIPGSSGQSKFFSIRIRDEGGGVSPSDMARIFSYAFTTAKNDHDEDGGGGPYAAQHVGGLANIGGGDTNLFSEITSKGLQTGLGTIAGLGYGLPMSKLYASYFGGSLSLVSLDGWGSDVSLKLRCLDEAGDATI
ncbi:atypical/PDHK/BCKDK protein kinase [Roridomyces roridus]|uniref:Protein-serine/threonine kinase n=1 Tax=Roridomyces roridus TaxID=1738132 RepID=A0AAD7BVV4_9AGAR|nr:atypical/PDHK/BCKDK protein kinase [Roridomyces roridus]